MSDFDPYHKWLGIPKKDQPPHHYRLLGIDLFEDDADVIDAAANRVMTYLQQCATGKHLSVSQKLLNEVAQARVALLNPSKKKKYDAELETRLKRERARAADDEVTFAEVVEEDAEPDPLAFLEGETQLSPSASSPAFNANVKGIPGWAVAFGLFVVAACCGLVGWKMLKESNRPAPEFVENSSDDGEMDEPNSTTEDNSANKTSSSTTSNDSNNASSKGNAPSKTVASNGNNSDTRPVTNPTETANSSTKPGNNPKPMPDPMPAPTEFVSKTGMKFVLIPKGEFLMGSIKDDPYPQDEKPRHRVVLSRAFLLSKFEATVADYDAVMKTSFVSDTANSKLPKASVTWQQAMDFCRQLSQQEGLHCRLPTEAEWEYACRAGTRTEYSWGADPQAGGDYGWFERSDSTLHPVGEKKPNQWGLHDMYGNVAEWCYDAYAPHYYDLSRLQDPIGPVSNSIRERVIRGGAVDVKAPNFRSATRSSQTKNAGNDLIGFRVLIEVDQWGEPLATSQPNPFAQLTEQPIGPLTAETTTQPQKPMPQPVTPPKPEPTVAVATLQPTPASEAPPRPANVPEEAVYWRKNWYWFPKERVPFKDALRSATSKNGRLVAITSQLENDFVTGQIHGPTLIGCARIQKNWVNSLQQTQTYFNWAKGQPSNLRGEDYTVLLKTGLWNDNFADSLNYIVEWGDEE